MEEDCDVTGCLPSVLEAETEAEAGGWPEPHRDIVKSGSASRSDLVLMLSMAPY